MLCCAGTVPSLAGSVCPLGSTRSSLFGVFVDVGAESSAVGLSPRDVVFRNHFTLALLFIFKVILDWRCESSSRVYALASVKP
jgi:hypothetical protein